MRRKKTLRERQAKIVRKARNAAHGAPPEHAAKRTRTERGAAAAVPTNVAAIRVYAPARDAGDLRACFVALQEFERALEPALPRGEDVADAYLAHVLARGAVWDGVILVAEVDGRVVGFVSVWARVPQDEPDEPPADYAAVSDLGVLPEFRGRGLGRALLDAAERHARSRGATALRIGVLARNAGARRLYEDVGFVDYRVQMTKRL